MADPAPCRACGHPDTDCRNCGMWEHACASASAVGDDPCCPNCDHHGADNDA